MLQNCKSHQQLPKIAKPEGHLIKDIVDSKKRNNEYIRNHDKSMESFFAS